MEMVRYEIRGPVYEKAEELERQGYKITCLNIGNPAPYGFDTPDEMIHDIIVNIRDAQGYSDSRGLYPARRAIYQYARSKAIQSVDVEDIYIGNGVSELIMVCTQALLNPGDEMLLPAPDYPLWTSAVTLAGGKAVHYRCDEQSDWMPDLDDLVKKITPKTKGLVVINPNNPTGAVYNSDMLQKLAKIGEEHKLVLLSDEIYDKILYDDVAHHPLAAFVEDTICITLGGLSKNYRSAGFRAGWMIPSGAKAKGKSFMEGIHTLATMRLCANVTAQLAIQVALGGYQSINDLVLPNGRLRRQRDLAYNLLNNIPGVSCVKPKGAFYIFPKIDLKKFRFQTDMEMVLDMLEEKRVLLVQGTGFNWPEPDHFRLVFLPPPADLENAITKMDDYFQSRLL